MKSQNNEIEIGLFISNVFNKLNIFFRKNIYYILIIIIIGTLLGYFYSYQSKSYESKIIISPNYGSVDYLYNEIELINSKIKEKDLNFLNKNKISNSIKEIEVKPINNIYQFVQENEKNFDLLKLFAEDGDINKVSVDEKTSKNYKTHEIIINSSKNSLKVDDIENVLNYLNNNEYYNKLRLIIIENEKTRLLNNENTIKQIDEIISKTNNSNLSHEVKNFVYVNDNNQLNDLLNTKRDLLRDNDYIRSNEISSSNVIKNINESLNIQTESKSNFYSILFTIIMLIIFILIRTINLKKII